jgi:hypothetical protein
MSMQKTITTSEKTSCAIHIAHSILK